MRKKSLVELYIDTSMSDTGIARIWYKLNAYSRTRFISRLIMKVSTKSNIYYGVYCTYKDVSTDSYDSYIDHYGQNMIGHQLFYFGCKNFEEAIKIKDEIDSLKESYLCCSEVFKKISNDCHFLIGPSNEDDDYDEIACKLDELEKFKELVKSTATDSQIELDIINSWK